MKRACILLAVGVLLGAGPAWAGERGCGDCAADCTDGKIKHCCQRLAGWICYMPATRTGLDCIGRVPPAAYPPLYTFFPCSACNELPPYVLSYPCCGRCVNAHRTCTFKKKPFTGFAPCTDCEPCDAWSSAYEQHKDPACDQCKCPAGACTDPGAMKATSAASTRVRPAVLGQPQPIKSPGGACADPNAMKRTVATSTPVQPVKCPGGACTDPDAMNPTPAASTPVQPAMPGQSQMLPVDNDCQKAL